MKLILLLVTHTMMTTKAFLNHQLKQITNIVQKVKSKTDHSFTTVA